ncbi:DUF2515 family protein [Sutcliffiella horikoshii]|uniref:DUF2515 domain-containing protein n=1 Tax=Sutcliffiella horikoshii TaxID=79883 RepID=A0A5D4THJ7_9BACI|nr:DUF2515 family protein [Sutcliffiella horikoshii]TYS74755.1 DUF2515 domain-containing protein [Sutcliffiella horikoshii]
MFGKWFTGTISKPQNNHLIKLWTTTEENQLKKEWTKSPFNHSPSLKEQDMLAKIRTKTASLNRNNVTRTQAYLDLYLKHPEVHWSFLAHMVSRNGGWNMTDLKASHISTLLSYEKASILFRFLEKANHLIFQDAYPQLLLYEESKKAGRPLFYLLSEFHVSPFMNPIWTLFFNDNSKKELLTVSLIINEQNFIESNLLQNAFFQQKVLSSLTYQLQEKLGFTLVLFPYRKGSNTLLTGLGVQQFSNLSNRIEIGKKLYILLFKNKDVLQGALRFSKENFHTGSREDYLPVVFSATSDSRRIYSPTIEAAWADIDHPSIVPVAWFKDIQEVIKFFHLPSTMEPADMEKTHLYNLMKLTGISELHGVFFNK